MTFSTQTLANSIGNAHKYARELLSDYEPSVGGIVMALHSVGPRPVTGGQHLDGRHRSGSGACFAVLSKTALRA